MGARGPKPQPTLLRQIHGNPAKRPLNANEPMPVGDLDEPPDWLTDAQKDGWRYAIDHAPPGMMKRLDRGLLVTWVIAEDLHRQAAIAQSKVGLLIKSPTQQVPLQSPFLPIINKQALIMMKAAGELGFTPSSRSRINAPEAADTARTYRQPGSAAPESLDAFLATDPDNRRPTIN